MIKIQSKAFSTKDSVMASFHGPRYRCPFHLHQLAEIAYVTDGEVMVKTLDKVTVAKSGDMVFVPPYQPHAFFSEDGKEVKIWLLLFSHSLTIDIFGNESTFDRYSSVVFTPSEELRIYISKQLFDTNELLVDISKSELPKIKAIIYPILNEYLQTVSEVGGQSSLRSNTVVDTLKYVSAHFMDENLTLNDISKAIGYSHSQISHTLNSVLGVNLKTLINSMKIDYAKHLLLFSEKSIYNISVESGFSCERSFHRAFKTVMGTTPLEYKRLRKGNKT